MSAECTPASPRLLTNETLTVLMRELPSTGVLSLVLDVNPANAVNWDGGLRSRAKYLLAGSGAPQLLIRSVLDNLEPAQRSPLTRLYFLWDEHGHVQRRSVDAQLDVLESASFGVPDLEPLHGALESSPRVLIVLVNRRWGRLFGVYLGTITELYRLENRVEPDTTFRVHGLTDPVPTQPNDHNWPQNAQQDRRFLQAVLAQLQRLRQVGAFEHLLLAGSLQGRAALSHQLNADLQSALRGDFPLVGEANAAEVLDLAGQALAQLKGQTETALLNEALKHGLIGVEATLQAVQEGRVRQLLVADGGADVRVWEDSSGHLFAALPGQGLGSLENRALREVLVSLREQFGLTIRFLSGLPAARLKSQLGGLAAVPRF